MKSLIKKLLDFSGRTFAGLDIDDRSVKAVQLHKDNDGFCVTAAGCFNIKSLREEGFVDAEQITVEAIRRCVEMSEIKGGRVVCAVDGPDVSVRAFNLPPMGESEIESAILTEAEHVSPTSIDQTVIDYQLLDNPSGEGDVYGVLVAASVQAVCRKNYLVTEANLENVLMDVDSIALLNCFSIFGDPAGDATLAILNVTNSFANLVVFAKDKAPFVRNISIGSSDIIEQIAANIGFSFDEVEDAVCCSNEDGVEIPLYIDSLDAAVDVLASKVSETLRYYSMHNSDGEIAKIYLCGEGSLITDLDLILGEKLPYPVELFNPFANINFSSNVSLSHELRQQGSSMVVATGLALRSN
ncbi:MAG: type IV pilus assembly protein PilM [Planctomycetes bacterium]|nr:type IV pilus assembly protein PilM [Planctomycetota bacterium]